MNREVHVRFWEGLAVRFRWATQLISCWLFKEIFPTPFISSLSVRAGVSGTPRPHGHKT